MRTARSHSGRPAGIARNVNPRCRISARASVPDNPYQALRARTYPRRSGFEAYRQFIRRLLPAA